MSKSRKPGKRTDIMQRIIQEEDSGRLILLNKPFQVMCQFTSESDKRNLSEFVRVRGVYPVGRLDFDSEGLVVLTNAGWLQNAIAHPQHHFEKTYLVQVEGIPESKSLEMLRAGITLSDGPTKPAVADLIEDPDVWERKPPIRERKSIPVSWLRIRISEGRNRQVRRMTAAIGFPTLRLIRESVGPWSLNNLGSGEWKEVPCPQSPSALQRLVLT